MKEARLRLRAAVAPRPICARGSLWGAWVLGIGGLLGFGVPYFNTFFLKGTFMKQKFILFSPCLLKSHLGLGLGIGAIRVLPLNLNLRPKLWRV